ncbi:choloylglycine hydrolase [Rothia sp. CCM 9418]|uniref:choloylglycine hydrolase n=1 Tax=Rothia sp. CCM 9418 TaxID=3402661 RepID=UPI003AECDF5F
MCTALTFSVNGETYYGRNLDLNCGFGEEVVITPRNYTFNFTDGSSSPSHYCMIGMATVVNNYPLYAEASNEKGLSIAGLNFPDNAHYFEPHHEKTNVSPYELIPWVLSRYASVDELKVVLPNLNLTHIAFAQNMPLAPLHWMVSDSQKSIVIESTTEGLKFYDNPFGVLTNNPPFPYHLENIKNYINLTPEWPANNVAPEQPLNPVGVGFGGFGLPGDSSPASRFVKAVFLRSSTLNHLKILQETAENQQETVAVSQFFHILDNVGMVKGSCFNEQGECEHTVYSSCCNTSRGIYYYKTYDNSCINAIEMSSCDTNGKELIQYPLVRHQTIHYAN